MKDRKNCEKLWLVFEAFLEEGILFLQLVLHTESVVLLKIKFLYFTFYYGFFPFFH